MKKIIKFMSLVVLMTAMFASMINVSAEDAKQIKFVSSTQFNTPQGEWQTILFPWNNKSGNAGSTYKIAEVQAGNGVQGGQIAAYCFNMNQAAPSGNTTLTRRELTAKEKQYESAFIYILQNGYKLKNNTFGAGLKSNNEKYYATQIAIWALQGSLSYNNLVVNNDARKRIYDASIALYNNAMAEANKPYVEPSISITGANNNMTITADNQFYRSADLVVKGSGFSEYNVALVNIPNNMAAQIVVVGSNKVVNSGATLKAGERFYVRIPVKSVNEQNANLNFKVSIGAKTTYNKLAIYKSSEANRQDVGVPLTYTKQLKSELSLNLNATGKLIVKKVEKKSDGSIALLPNVTIKVTNAKGEVVGTWNTKDAGGNPKEFPNLPLGTYYIEEVSAPEGYMKVSKREVTLTSSEPVTVTLVNSKNVTISKVDATTGSELPGAHLVLKTITGKVIDEWTSSDVPHEIKVKLEPGMTYELTETIAPDGYQKSSETIRFTANADGGVDEPVVMKNMKVSNVKISKVDITNKKELPGATLEVRDAQGNLVDKWVSTSQPHYLPATLAPGKYTLKETIAPKGYLLTEEIIEFTITADGVEQTITMTNEPTPETAGENVVLIVTGLIVTVVLAGFSIFKINKQNA